MPDTSSERVFREVFRERRDHASKLAKCVVEFWWDGEFLLFLAYVARRHNVEHDWPDDEERVRAGLSQADGPKSAVVRKAIVLADEFYRTVFIEDDATMGDRHD